MLTTMIEEGKLYVDLAVARKRCALSSPAAKGPDFSNVYVLRTYAAPPFRCLLPHLCEYPLNRGYN